MRILERIPYRRSLRKLLNRLTVTWLVIYVPAILILALRGQVLSGLRWLFDAPAWLWALVVLHTLVVVAGWSVVGYNWWQSRQQAVEERITAQSVAELHALPPDQFEAFVAQTFRGAGFKVWDIRFTADHGVDLQVITSDGAPAVAQVKRYQDRVGEPTVRDLYGTMINAGADRAYLINTGGFSQPAREWAEGKPITLIDGRQLLQMQGTREQRSASS